MDPTQVEVFAVIEEFGEQYLKVKVSRPIWNIQADALLAFSKTPYAGKIL